MERVKAIFEYAIELQPDEREKFLEKACSDDPGLRADVQTMIDHSQADTVELPPPERPPQTTEPIKFIFGPGDLIAERYRVIRAVAKGGMGEVYEVQDLELGSRVALKTISLKSAARPNAVDMFRREIQLARQVTHPNVCRIYDIGHHRHDEHGDMLFLTMEFLPGDTLAQRIRNQGPLTKEEALPLVRQMIQALSAAHRLSIVHRDFKSANVILCDPIVKRDSGSASAAASGSNPSLGSKPRSASGSASRSGSGSGSGSEITMKVTDFGLARSVDGLETTVHNEVWGTPDYMAPEQFHGESSTASDIYSLGVVIYEMFSAKLPHRSSTGVSKPDGKPGTAMEKVPSEWRPVVKRCMAYEPSERYATVDEVWLALTGELPADEKHNPILGMTRRTAAAVALAVVLALGLAGWMARDKIARIFNPLPEQKHIAVLPFDNIGGDPVDAAFSEGIGETLTSKLSQLQRFQNSFWVVPFSDSRKQRDVEEAYRKLNVTMVVTGSLQRTRQGINLTANLVDAKNHKQLDSRVVKASVGDLDVLQDRVWEAVADMMDLQVNSEARRTVAAGGTKEPGAYEFYEQGSGYLLRHDPQHVDEAITLFAKALDKDPNYALAYAGLGQAYAVKYILDKDPALIDQATSNGLHALKLNDGLAPVHTTMGRIYQQTGKYEEALQQYRRALSIDSADPRALYEIAEVFEAQGKYAEAEEQLKQTLDHRKGDWAGYSNLGAFYYRHGELDKAAQLFQNMIDLAPDQTLGYEDLGGTYIALGRYDQAIETLKKGLKLESTAPMWSNLGTAYFYVQRYPEAAEAMAQAAELSPHNHNYWRNLGDSYRQIPARKDEARQAYQKALDAAQAELKVNPNDVEALSGIALYQAHLGHKAEAEAAIRQAVSGAPGDSDTLFTSALVYEIIGHRNDAVAALEKAYNAGYPMEYILKDPELSALRTDTKYQQWYKKSSSASAVPNHDRPGA